MNRRTPSVPEFAPPAEDLPYRVSTGNGWLVFSAADPLPEGKVPRVGTEVLPQFIQLEREGMSLESLQEFATVSGPLSTFSRRLASLETWKNFELTISPLKPGPSGDSIFEPVVVWRSLAAEASFLARKGGQLRRAEYPRADYPEVPRRYGEETQATWAESRDRLLIAESREPYPGPKSPTFVRTRSPRPVELIELWDRDAIVRNGRYIEEPTIEEVLRAERELLDEHLGQFFELANLRPAVVWKETHIKRGRDTGASLGFAGRGLLATVAEALWKTVATSADYYLCDGCQTVFLFEAGPGRRRPQSGHPIYCRGCHGDGTSKLNNTKRWRSTVAARKK